MKISNQLMSVLVAASLSSSLTATEKPKEVPVKTQKCKAVNSAAIGKLVLNLGHNESKVRIAAVNSLTKIGLPAIGALQKALKHKDPEVTQNAKSILATISLANIKPVKKKIVDNCPGCGLG